MRDICRWHVEEFAYLLGKLNSIREGDGTLLDHTCLLYVHEHAEADDHKNRGLAVVVAGQTSAGFTVTAPDNALFDGTRAVTLTATAPGLIAATTNASVTDNDPRVGGVGSLAKHSS